MTEPFLEALQLQYENLGRDDLLKPFRKKAWDQFIELGLPSKKIEVWQYVKLKNLYEMGFSLAVKDLKFKESPNSIIFVNGHFVSSTFKMATPLNQAIATYGAFLSNQWMKSLKSEKNAFALINQALSVGGAFVYIPPKTVIDEPIEIKNYYFGDFQGKWPYLALRFLWGLIQRSVLLKATILTQQVRGLSINSLNFI